MKKIFSYQVVLAIFLPLVFSCADKNETVQKTFESSNRKLSNPSLVLLGTIQDAGFPQMGCKKDCCKEAFSNPSVKRNVISLGLVDPKSKKSYLFEATPDIVQQTKRLVGTIENNVKEVADGIFLTHAHMGHYTGLMYLGKESMNAERTPVFAMPKMKKYLEENGPWSQLVSNDNIALLEIKPDIKIYLENEIQVAPFIVPHRDEFSETVGYLIEGPTKKAMFIPDIDKWEKWDRNVIDEIKKVDYAFLDATFFSGEEINNRDISEIPHPFVIESMEKFKGMSAAEKEKIIFIHFNHTNPLVDINSPESRKVLKAGFRIGEPNDVFEL